MAPRPSSVSPARSLSPIYIAPCPSTAPAIRFTAARTAAPNAIGPTKEWMLPPRPKPGRKLATDRSSNKRKAQNRAAQRAFRERRAARVGELEEQLKETEEERHKCEIAMREQIDSQNNAIVQLEKQVQRFSDEIKAWHKRYLQLEKRLAHEEQGKNAALIKLRHLRNHAVPAAFAGAAGPDAAPSTRRHAQRPPPIYVPHAQKVSGAGNGEAFWGSCSPAKEPLSPASQATFQDASIIAQYAVPARCSQNLAAILNTPLPSHADTHHDSRPRAGTTASPSAFTTTATTSTMTTSLTSHNLNSVPTPCAICPHSPYTPQSPRRPPTPTAPPRPPRRLLPASPTRVP